MCNNNKVESNLEQEQMYLLSTHLTLTIKHIREFFMNANRVKPTPEVAVCNLKVGVLKITVFSVHCGADVDDSVPMQ